MVHITLPINIYAQYTLHNGFLLQELSYLRSRFDIIIPGNQIPDWFNDEGRGSTVIMQLPPDWHDPNWIGLTLCAAFVIHDHRSFSDVVASSNDFFGYYTHELGCSIKVNGQALCKTPVFWFKEEMGKIKSQHLWLLYLSKDYLGKTWRNDFNEIEISFEVKGPSLELKKCGACLVYDPNMKDFNQSITASSSREMDPYFRHMVLSLRNDSLYYKNTRFVMYLMEEATLKDVLLFSFNNL